MAKSPEYPDLTWMEPASWTNANRTSVQLVVIHTTEGSARGTSAEDGASYDARRTDGTSTHYFHDSNSTIQCVRTEDQAHAARAQGNRRGIQHELCARAGSANWADIYHQAMLRLAARQAARDARKWGIPVRKLAPDQVASGVKGFCGHVDITMAFPQDHGTHTDPGKNFPWSRFLGMVQAELDGDDMATADEIVDALLAKRLPYPYGPDGDTRTIEDLLRYIPSRDTVAGAVDAKLAPRLAVISTALSAVAENAGQPVDLSEQDVTEIVTGLLAGLPADLAKEIAQQTLDEAATRLSGEVPPADQG